ncbi:hypothetical protein K438DRAFT_813615 [Mycena galopus ATCC 62051]|nr:hypothetical protein K438DRAFT_813615 [Mycena galopus ATCC 62051]
MSSDSVFGYDDHNVPNGHLLPPNQFRPLSVLSFHNGRSPMKEDDTMISWRWPYPSAMRAPHALYVGRNTGFSVIDREAARSPAPHAHAAVQAREGETGFIDVTTRFLPTHFRNLKASETRSRWTLSCMLELMLTRRARAHPCRFPFTPRVPWMRRLHALCFAVLDSLAAELLVSNQK